MRGFWGEMGGASRELFQDAMKAEGATKAKGFDKNQEEIEKVAKYLKAKRVAFYRNNNIEER